MANYTNEWIKKRKHEIMLNVICIKCGSIENLEYAHIKPTGLSGMGRGRKERFYDLLRHPDSYIVLCHGCHEAMDALSEQSL